MFFHAVYFIPQITENIYRMVGVRAEGGFGCVSTGEIPANFEESRGAFMDRAIDIHHYYGSDFDKAKEYADRIHAGGALAYFEFSHEALRLTMPISHGGRKTWCARTAGTSLAWIAR